MPFTGANRTSKLLRYLGNSDGQLPGPEVKKLRYGVGRQGR